MREPLRWVENMLSPKKAPASVTPKMPPASCPLRWTASASACPSACSWAYSARRGVLIQVSGRLAQWPTTASKSGALSADQPPRRRSRTSERAAWTPPTGSTPRRGGSNHISRGSSAAAAIGKMPLA